MTTDARPPAAATSAASARTPELPAAVQADPRPGGRVALDVTLPRAAYVDPAVFAEERERIFVREWFCIGREEELPNPGEYLLVEVAGESVVVVRGADGALYGHYNVCRHRGCQVALAEPAQPAAPSPADPAVPGRREAADPPGPTGAFAGNRIRCPYHSWTYELDGRVRTAPFLSDRDDFDRGAFSLHPVGVATWGGFVFVNLEPGEAAARGHDLAAQLGEIPARVARYPMAELRIARRIVYEVRANWKVILENYNECYHCGTVHPELCDLVPAFRRGGGGGLDWEAGIPHREGAWTFTSSGTTNRQPFAGLDEAERTRHFGELIYPNVMLSLAADHAAAFTLWPTAADRTTIVFDVLVQPLEMAKPDYDPMDAVGFWDLVNGQDWTVCEGTQRGMSSRAFTHGHYAPMEDLSADMRRYIGEKLGRAALGDAAAALDTPNPPAGPPAPDDEAAPEDDDAAEAAP